LSENLYEGMFLVDSGKFATDPDGVSGQILKILERAGATVVEHRPWQDGKLAYPIENHRKGLHYLTYFRMPGSGTTEVTRACKLNETILRHMLIKHEATMFDAMVAALTSGAAGPPEAEEFEDGDRDRKRRPHRHDDDDDEGVDALDDED
jgi:small subunit ribosomal protein S6